MPRRRGCPVCGDVALGTGKGRDVVDVHGGRDEQDSLDGVGREGFARSGVDIFHGCEVRDSTNRPGDKTCYLIRDMVIAVQNVLFHLEFVRLFTASGCPLSHSGVDEAVTCLIDAGTPLRLVIFSLLLFHNLL